jgi:transcriptional regulator with XRE-family HTH domain
MSTEKKLTDIDAVIGKNVAAMRKAASLTQTQLGQAMSTPVSEQAVSKWENAASRIGAAQLVEIANALCCTVGELLEGVEGVLRDGSLPAARSAKVVALEKAYTSLDSPEVQDAVSNLTHALALELGKNLRRIDRHD